MDRVLRYLEVTPFVDTGDYLPEDFKGYEYRVYQDPGTGNFWDSTDPLIQIKFSPSPVRFDLREFARPRLSIPGVQYRVACRVIDVNNTYISSPAYTNIVITSLI